MRPPTRRPAPPRRELVPLATLRRFPMTLPGRLRQTSSFPVPRSPFPVPRSPSFDLGVAKDCRRAKAAIGVGDVPIPAAMRLPMRRRLQSQSRQSATSTTPPPSSTPPPSPSLPPASSPQPSPVVPLHPIFHLPFRTVVYRKFPPQRPPPSSRRPTRLPPAFRTGVLHSFLPRIRRASRGRASTPPPVPPPPARMSRPPSSPRDGRSPSSSAP